MLATENSKIHPNDLNSLGDLNTMKNSNVVFDVHLYNTTAWRVLVSEKDQEVDKEQVNHFV